jgi:Co/Zn/Cd efflux system component
LTLHRLQGFQSGQSKEIAMSAHCCAPAAPAVDPGYRRVLWIALVINATMFAAELWAAASSGSVSLLADSIDFFGDAANYALSLAVLGMALQTRARAAAIKAASMGLFGGFVLGRAAWSATSGAAPEPITMGVVGSLALAANVAVALMLFRHRLGDANMRSAWICSRNDAVGNLAVMLAALGVFGTGSAWPDLAVAALMAVLAVSGAGSVLRQARGELRQARAH